jgi:hypothetical protein
MAASAAGVVTALMPVMHDALVVQVSLVATIWPLRPTSEKRNWPLRPFLMTNFPDGDV